MVVSFISTLTSVRSLIELIADYPSYELYTDALRMGTLTHESSAQQLRLIIGRDRRVLEVLRL